MEKPNCYKCKHRGSVPGDAHSCCRHPALKDIDANPFGMLFDLFTGKAAPAMQELNIKADSHGVRMGWFLWPANFDPVWLINCDGFTDIDSYPLKEDLSFQNRNEEGDL